MRTNIKSFCISFILASTLLFPNIGKAQKVYSGEQLEGRFAWWSLTLEQTRVQVGATKQEFNIFTKFNKQALDSLNWDFAHKVTGSASMDDLKEYAQKTISPLLLNLFAGFRKIEQEFPSSVDEYRNPPKFRPGGDSCFASCYNTDFEDGSLDGWYGYYAVNSSGTAAFSITGITGGYCGHVTQAGGPDANTNNSYQIHITSGSLQDAFLQSYSTYSMPQVSPWGGQHSVMLGDSDNHSGNFAEPHQGTAILSQSFQVTAATSNLTYQYAVFLENPNHPYYEQPFFSVAILDQKGDTIPTCGLYQVDATNAHANHFVSIFYPHGGDTVFWKDWTIVNVPLKKYIGQCVTIVFQSQDCSAGGHFGYAYVDASCSPAALLPSSPNFCGQDSISLTAPPGAIKYQWAGPLGKLYNGIRGSDSSQTIWIDSSGIYRAIITPVTGASCTDTLYDTIGKLPGPFPHPRFKADTVCAGVPMRFINLSHPDSGSFSWDFYNLGIYNYTNILFKDTTWIYASGGTYTVKLHQLANGCGLDTLINVHVAPTVGPPKYTAAPLCSGDSTLITANATNAITYSWNFGDPASGLRNTSSLQNTGHVYKTAGTYTVSLKAVNLCEYDTSFVITITATPKPSITGVNLICVNTTDVLTATGAATYVWNPGNLSGSTVTVTPNGPTTYTVTASNGVCTHDTTFTVNTYPPPVTSVSPKSDTVCAGTKVVITGSGLGVYKWSNGQTTTSITVSPLVTTKYYLRDSIKGSLCLDTASATIIIRTPIKTSISNDTAVCPHQPVTILVGESGEPPFYIWNTGATTSSIIVAPAVTTTYTAIVSGLYCNHDTLTEKVTVVPLPKPVISGPNWRCYGIKDTLKVTGGVTYKWSNGTTDTIIHTIKIIDDTSIYVTAYNKLGCPADTFITVKLRPGPLPSINSLPPFCSGQPIALAASATGTFPPFTYKWSTGQTGTSILIDPGPTSQTTYTVYVSNGCISGATTTVTPDIPYLTACCNQTLVIEADSTTRNDTTILVATGGSIIKYQWQEQPENGQIICLTPDCDKVKVITTTTTTYTVTGTDANGCTTEEFLTVTIDIPCFDLLVPNVFTPTLPGPQGLNGEFYIRTKDVDAWTITIFDRWGKEVYKSADQYQYWKGTTESGGKASDGVYYYVITATCQNTTYKKDGFVQLIR